MAKKEDHVIPSQQAPEITRRENWIIERALFYAGHFIEGLPAEHQASSDRSDMLTLLRARLGDKFMAQAEIFGWMLERTTGRPFNAEEH